MAVCSAVAAKYCRRSCQQEVTGDLLRNRMFAVSVVPASVVAVGCFVVEFVVIIFVVVVVVQLIKLVHRKLDDKVEISTL